MVKIKSPFTYVFTLDDYHNQCVYFFRALLENISDKKIYNLLRNFYLENDDYYTTLFDALTNAFNPIDEYLILACSRVDTISEGVLDGEKKIIEKKSSYLNVSLYKTIILHRDLKQVGGFEEINHVKFNL